MRTIYKWSNNLGIIHEIRARIFQAQSLIYNLSKLENFI